MNSSLASGVVSGGAAVGVLLRTEARVLRLPPLTTPACAPPQGDEAARNFGEVFTGESGGGSGEPGPRRRNSEMMSWPALTDSSSLRMVAVPVLSAMDAPVAFEST